LVELGQLESEMVLLRYQEVKKCQGVKKYQEVLMVFVSFERNATESVVIMVEGVHSHLEFP
jgi:hypothetical protein